MLEPRYGHFEDGALWPGTDHEASCTRCVLSGPADYLQPDDEGRCRFCRDFDARWPDYCFTPEQEEENLKGLVKTIRDRRRKGSKYDVAIGMSGGVDSSYIALLCQDLGLETLVLHFDNGWNSKQAVDNIRRIVDTTGFDLETYVIDWPEFRDLQRSLLKAGVIAFEIATDHAIQATMVGLARRNRIATVLSGSNFATEHGEPGNGLWNWPTRDLRQIKAIQRRFGTRSLRHIPKMSSLRYEVIRSLGLAGQPQWPLNMINYSKTRAMASLQERFGWQYYGGKHYESLITKFFQAYILPVKFGVDKRPVYLSAQVRIGDIPREEAMKELRTPLYPADELARDHRFVCKKLGFTAEEFDGIMAAEPVPHSEYPSDQSYYRFLTHWGSKVRRLI